MYRFTKKIIENMYKDLKPYFNHINNNDEDLQQMCKQCKQWRGKEHNYESCKDKMCFKFFLAFEYLEQIGSSQRC